jgi:hypothetical protein
MSLTKTSKLVLQVLCLVARTIAYFRLPAQVPDISNHSSTAFVPGPVSATPSFREKIIVIMQPLVSPVPKTEISHVNRSPSLLARAILVVDPAAESRMRYQTLVNGQWSLPEILDDALQLGTPFELGLDYNALPSFVPNSLPAREPFYATGFRDQALQWTNPMSFYAAWREAARRIFNRPHARAFLFKGGLLWRLPDFSDHPLSCKARHMGSQWWQRHVMGATNRFDQVPRSH